jgi:hypothetical protein
MGLTVLPKELFLERQVWRTWAGFMWGMIGCKGVLFLKRRCFGLISITELLDHLIILFMKIHHGFGSLMLILPSGMRRIDWTMLPTVRRNVLPPSLGSNTHSPYSCRPWRWGQDIPLKRKQHSSLPHGANTQEQNQHQQWTTLWKLEVSNSLFICYHIIEEVWRPNTHVIIPLLLNSKLSLRIMIIYSLQPPVSPCSHS